MDTVEIGIRESYKNKGSLLTSGGDKQPSLEGPHSQGLFSQMFLTSPIKIINKIKEWHEEDEDVKLVS